MKEWVSVLCCRLLHCTAMPAAALEYAPVEGWVVCALGELQYLDHLADAVAGQLLVNAAEIDRTLIPEVQLLQWPWELPWLLQSSKGQQSGSCCRGEVSARRRPN